jgi:prepilin-type processing-associated H-X9-DG protein
LQALAVLGRNTIGEQRRTLERLPQQEAKGVQLALDLADQLLATAKFVTKDQDVEMHASSQLSPAAAVQFLLPAVTAAREAARRTQGANSLKQIALPMFHYHDTHGRFPPAVLYGPDGKTPHSWRVEILPYIGQEALYKQYNLDEPWDSPHNLKLLEKIPAFYRSPKDAPGSTNAAYFALTGPETVFSGKEGVKLSEIADGPSYTLLLVEAKRDIPWTKPEDILYEKDKPLPKLGGFNREGFNAAWCDGSVRFISEPIDEQILRAMITKSGGEPNPFPPAAVPAVPNP